MRVRFEMSGGYGGLFTAEPLACDVNTNELSGTEEEEFHRLIDDSGLLALEEAETPSTTPVRDAIEYRIWMIDDGGRSREYAFDDTTVPVEARPLLDHLRTMALSQRSGDV